MKHIFKIIICLTVFLLIIVFADYVLWRIGQSITLEYVAELELPLDNYQAWAQAYEDNSKRLPFNCILGKYVSVGEQSRPHILDLMLIMKEVFSSDQFAEAFSNPDTLDAEALFNLDLRTFTYGNNWWGTNCLGVPFQLGSWSVSSNEGELIAFGFDVQHPVKEIMERLVVLAKRFIVVWYEYDRERFNLQPELCENDIIVRFGRQTPGGYFGKFWFLNEWRKGVEYNLSEPYLYTSPSNSVSVNQQNPM